MKYVNYGILLILVLILFNCSLVHKNHPVQIYIKNKDIDLKSNSLLIFNFKEPGYALESGIHAAQLCHQKLLKAKTFKTISIENNSPWNRLGETDEERLQNAISEGREKHYSTVLVGEIIEYIYGGINQSRIQIKLRIIDVNSKTTLFYAGIKKSNSSKDPSYPLDTKLADPAMSPDELLNIALLEIIKEI
jgi:hypothetical protein